ncbi:nucleotidyltransferase domain-containing protein [Micromonospora inyonensis]|uniref:Nucleotidyltransferase domain-containing protein n=1 Tax=Micromonospora inyonensis TaxID=47866 RepID=A0A1C6RLJ4_9ACTN|nr:nucleotidyltransferase domain-containing protein [Micromonospora inyonensis]SCL18046.1 Nucleotidyltransferase domain-containing protein [Micromonospora inyonensis]
MEPSVKIVLDRVRDGVADLPGIAGIALGGSHARGTADANSDIDVGLYYHRNERPDMQLLREVFTALDDAGAPAGVGGYGDWGPWINGGAWLQVAGRKTDILLRELERVDDVVRECVAGRPQICYQVGHPHGFCTVIYAGEVSYNQLVHDPQHRLEELRALTRPYPQPLRRAILDQFGWEAGFALGTATSAAKRGDAAYVIGCVFRSIACLNQVVFALNGEYLTNEKGALAIAGGMPLVPTDYVARVNQAIALTSAAPEASIGALDLLHDLHAETMSLGGGS